MATAVVNKYTLAGVELRRVYLVRAHFEEGRPGPATDLLDYLVDLSLSRGSALALSVAVTVSTPEEAPLRMSATYAADFVLSDDTPEEERDEIMGEVAYRLAPPMLYSYIRQLFDDMTGRGRGRRITLPFLPVPLALAEGEARIPPPPPHT